MVTLSQPGRRRRRARRRSCARRLPASTGPATVLDDLDRFHALVVGPGLGREDDTVDVGSRDRRRAPRCPWSSTATGCSRWRGTPTAQRRCCAPARAPTVLTPHDGEFDLLTGHRRRRRPHRRRAPARRRQRARRAAQGAGHRRRRPRRRRPRRHRRRRAAATAGTGDVLAGHHRRAARQRASTAFEAAASAAWIHAEAARRGPAGRPRRRRPARRPARRPRLR